jgi:Tfp pilus assembly protein PilV
LSGNRLPSVGQKDCDERGVLAESLVATSILATALISLAQVLALCVSANDAAGRLTHATLLAAQKIEDLRASSAMALDGTGSDSPEPGFRREWTIGVLASDPEYVAVIEVAVTSRTGTTRLVALRTKHIP